MFSIFNHKIFILKLWLARCIIKFCSQNNHSSNKISNRLLFQQHFLNSRDCHFYKDTDWRSPVGDSFWSSSCLGTQTGPHLSFRTQSNKPGIAVHACNSSTPGAEAGGLPRVQGQSEQWTEFWASLYYRAREDPRNTASSAATIRRATNTFRTPGILRCSFSRALHLGCSFSWVQSWELNPEPERARQAGTQPQLTCLKACSTSALWLKCLNKSCKAPESNGG